MKYDENVNMIKKSFVIKSQISKDETFIKNWGF